jgi:hypothetical protein
MSTALLHTQTTVELFPLHIGKEEDGATEVGRTDTGVFISLPAEGVMLVRDLVAGVPLAEVSDRFAAAYGQTPELDDFLAALVECGFVRAIDGRPVLTSAPVDEAPRGWQLLGRMPTHWVAWLLSPPAVVMYILVWLAVPTVLAARPDLLPSADDAWLHTGVLANFAALTGLGWGLVFLHELAHLIAVRARGCTGHLRLSHRLHFLVAETDMSGVRSLPRRDRYAPYLAGMTWDATVLLGCLLLQLAGVDSVIPGAIAYLVMMTLLFELGFFMRTDIYYVIANALRLGNLMADTRHWLANQVARLRRHPAPYDLSAVPARELGIIRWYAVVVVLGVGVTLGQFVVLGLPLLARIVYGAAAQLTAGPTTGRFWDGTGLLLITVAHFGLLLVVIGRGRRRARQRVG